MNDEDLLQQAAICQTLYFDGFGAFRNINGVLRCIGFNYGTGAQLNLVISLPGADHAYRETRRALEEDSIRVISGWRSAKLIH